MLFSIFEDDEIYVFVSPRTYSLLRFKRSKCQNFRNTFRHMNTISNGKLSDPQCDRVNKGLTLVKLSNCSAYK